MVAYSFKKRFVAPIRYGLGLIMKDDYGNWLQCESVIEPGKTTSRPFDCYKDLEPGACPKRQTIRAVGKRRHARPGETLQLYTAMRTKQCQKISDARCVSVEPIRIVVEKLLIQTWVNGDFIGDLPHKFARDDGFADAHDMLDFWTKEHGLGQFDGFLIKWEPLP